MKIKTDGAGDAFCQVGMVLVMHSIKGISSFIKKNSGAYMSMKSTK